jgi:hypothetical protein
MTEKRAETEAIKAMLQARADSLAAQLAPDGRRSGRYWIARNPTREDRRAGSFWIKIGGDAAGCWRDEATGDKGDIFGLIAYVRGGDFKDVLIFARVFLGLGAMPEEKFREVAQKDAQEMRRRAEREAHELRRSRRQAKATWLNARPLTSGTFAGRYLATRGIYLADMARPPRALRYHPAQRHVEAGRDFPAILAAMTGPDGSFYAVHRTFIAPDGTGKAPADPPRKIWPQFLGAAIHLWRGAIGLPANVAGEQGLHDTLAITEGVEDGLSMAPACPELRVWAAGSLGNLQALRLPACAAEVIVCADNDWGKDQALALLERGLAALAGQGVPVRVARATAGKDVNDVLRGAVS